MDKLTPVEHWPANVPFAVPVAASTNPDVPTFNTPVVLPSFGVMFVGTWEGEVHEISMETGQLLENKWPATGQGAYMALTNDSCVAGTSLRAYQLVHLSHITQ
jgi:hypothetical protein